jgi:hypothetical protein
MGACKFDTSGIVPQGGGPSDGSSDGLLHIDAQAPDTVAPGPPGDIWVSTGAAPGGDGSFGNPYATISAAMCNGGVLTPSTGGPGACTTGTPCGSLPAAGSPQTIHVGAGVYTEDLTVFADCTLQGAGSAITQVRPATTGHSVIYLADGTGVTISDITVTGGVANGATLNDGGGIRWQGGSGLITRVIFKGNTCDDHGAGLADYPNPCSTLTVTDSIFTGNTGTGANGQSGGGTISVNVGATGSATLALVNDLVDGNNTVLGSGVFDYSNNTAVNIETSTFTGNTCSATGCTTLELAAVTGSAFTVDSTILWADVPLDQELPAAQTASYSDVAQACGNYAGTGNINADPMFTTTFGLMPLSPCIGAGSPTAEPSTDLNGAHRKTFDIGCFAVP